jgi:opacity protein-like surface antigen
VTRPRPIALALAVALVAVAAPAAADQDEQRLSLAGQLALVELDAFGTADTTEAYGGLVGFAWGWSDWLELGGDLGYQHRTNAPLDGGTLGELGGDGFTLYTTLHDLELAASGRLLLDLGPSHRIRPFLGLRTGVGLRMLGAPSLYNRAGLAATGDGDTAVYPLVGAELGASYRFGNALAVGLALHTTRATDQTITGLRLELSWFSYDWI